MLAILYVNQFIARSFILNQASGFRVANLFTELKNIYIFLEMTINLEWVGYVKITYFLYIFYMRIEGHIWTNFIF